MILTIIFIWLLQAMIASGINIIKSTRHPKGMIDFIKLTFAPYVIYCAIFNNKLLH